MKAFVGAIIIFGFILSFSCTGLTPRERKLLTSDDMDYNLISGAMTNHYEKVNAAIKAGADVDTRWSSSKQTPLMFAIERKNRKMAQLLIDRGADLEARDFRGWTAMNSAIRTGAEWIDFLHKRGAKIPPGAIMHALVNERRKEALHLVNIGADVNYKLKDGMTVFLQSCMEGFPEVVEALMAKGVDIHAKTNDGWSALKLARRSKHYKVVRILKKAGLKR